MPKIPAAPLCLALLVLLALPCPARADGVGLVDVLFVRATLGGVKLLLEDGGYAVFQEEYAQLDHGEAKTWTYFFEEGFTYVVIGAGDRNSSNLFFDVMRGHEKMKGEVNVSILGKVTPHAIPWFRVRPGKLLGIRATMKTCNVATCAYGFVVGRKALERGEDAPRELPPPGRDGGAGDDRALPRREDRDGRAIIPRGQIPAPWREGGDGSGRREAP